jgi:uncharacterized membrane protein (DUF106 family)
MVLSIPDSTIIVSLTAIGLAISSHAATRFLVDLKKERRMKQEVAEFDKEWKDALIKKDKVKEERLRKKKPLMDQMRLKASTGRLKVMLVTWIPFLILYYLMAELVGGFYAPVAHSPIPIPFIVNQNGTVPLLWWYMISSFAFNTIVGKLLGTT